MNRRRARGHLQQFGYDLTWWRTPKKLEPFTFFPFYFRNDTLKRARAAADAFERPGEGSEVKKWEVFRGQI